MFRSKAPEGIRLSLVKEVNSVIVRKLFDMYEKLW